MIKIPGFSTIYGAKDFKMTIEFKNIETGEVLNERDAWLDSFEKGLVSAEHVSCISKELFQDDDFFNKILILGEKKFTETKDSKNAELFLKSVYNSRFGTETEQNQQ